MCLRDRAGSLRKGATRARHRRWLRDGKVDLFFFANKKDTFLTDSACGQGINFYAGR